MTALADKAARLGPTLLTLALLIVAGFLAARWVTYFAGPVEAPPPAPRERPQLGAAAQAVAAAQLFGAAPAAGETVSNLNVKLRGVFAGGGSATGYAIVNAGGRDQATRIGGEVVPGVTLEAVHPGHVVLRRAGALERVNLEERTSAPTQVAAAPRYAQAAPPPAPGAAPSPQPSSNPGARFKRPEPYAPVGDVPTDSQPPSPPPATAPAAPGPAPKAPAPRPLSGAQSGPPPQGLVIQDVPPGSMLERIGLQPGDVVRSVNGEAVASEADVARVLQQRGMQGSFTAEVQRGGMTVPIAVSGQR